MGSRLWSAALLAGMAMASAAQSFDLTIDPDTSAFEGRTDWRLDMAGWLVGDHDPVSKPNGTQTFSRTGAKAKSKIGAHALANLSATGRTGIAGSLRLDMDDKGVSVSGLQCDFLASGSMSIAGSVKVRHRAFRTLQPFAEHPRGSFSLDAGDRVEQWSFSQEGPSRTVALRSLGQGRWFVSVLTPGSVSLGVPLFSEEAIVIGNLSMRVSGVLTSDGDTAHFAGNFETPSLWQGTLARELPEVQVSAGRGGGLLLWLDSGMASMRVAGRSTFSASTEPR